MKVWDRATSKVVELQHPPNHRKYDPELAVGRARLEWNLSSLQSSAEIERSALYEKETRKPVYMSEEVNREAYPAMGGCQKIICKKVKL